MKNQRSGAKKTNNYGIGRNVEIRVCNFLKKIGWDTILSPGSRGPADITASKKGTKWCIQVKFRKSIDEESMKNGEWHNLAIYSKKFKCVPILINVSKIPGSLLMNANYFCDIENPEVIRDISGIFIGADLGEGYFAFFHNMLDGSIVEP